MVKMEIIGTGQTVKDPAGLRAVPATDRGLVGRLRVGHPTALQESSAGP